MITALNDATLPNKNSHAHWSGIEGSFRSLTIAKAIMKKRTSCLIVTSSNEEAHEITKEISFFIDKSYQVVHFQDTETLPYDKEPPHSEVISSRAACARLICNSEKKLVVVCSVQTSLKLIPSHEHWLSSVELSIGDAVDLDHLEQNLKDLNYQPVITVQNRGEYRLNNNIIDLFPFGNAGALRIVLENQVIKSIKKLSVSRQLSSTIIKSFTALPANEFSTNKEARSRFLLKWKQYFGDLATTSDIYRQIRNGSLPRGLDSYTPMLNDCICLVDLIKGKKNVILTDGAIESASKYQHSIKKRYDEVSSLNKELIIKPGDLWVDVETFLGKCQAIGLIEITEQAEIDFGSKNTTFERKESVEAAVEMLIPWTSNVKKVVYCMSSDARREEMDFICDMLDQEPEWIQHYSEINDSLDGAAIALVDIKKGFHLPSEELLLITEKELFGQPIFQKIETDEVSTVEFSKFKDLQTIKIGDPLVHLQYGVGRFKGLVSLDYFDVTKEFLAIEYADDATTYVKMEDLDFVSRYSGIDQDKAPLDVVGSEKWLKGLQKSYKDITSSAQSLIKIHSEKELKIGISMAETDHRYEKFCSEFPFQETHDQLEATNDIIHDLQSSTPMDRIVCGDVGFGKTEVAMRAAFHAAASGYQVAIMVPSTILAQQHYSSFKQRFSSFSFNIECMTRFSKKSDEQNVLKDLVSGDVDIIIGTHRIIQSDVRYRKLGLLIIDEEHRFGVKQKEQLRKMRSDMNLLSMTATPIPRTLSMSMHGIRDLSTITTPPAKRLSIRTFVNELSEDLINEAITRELLRSGQVFYVHNSIETIDKAAEKIKKLFPEASIAVGHAKMSERELEDIMAKFYSKEFDVLVCTTIIETGIDVPNANTIIIEKATNFGIAQLHQLRGRVGRSSRQAYAYLCTDSGRVTDDAKKRLTAMSSANSLGEGFMLANHDLEIRGAGEILGDKQSGHIQAIGFQLYMRLLERAIEILKEGRDISGDFKDQLHVDMDIGISSLIPGEYIEDQSIRLSFYKRIANAQDLDELNQVKNEMCDRFGPLPLLTESHLKIAAMKFKLSDSHVSKIIIGDNGGYLNFDSHNESGRFLTLAQKRMSDFRLETDSKLSFTIKSKGLTERTDLIDEITS